MEQDLTFNLLQLATDLETFTALQSEAAETLPSICEEAVWPRDGSATFLSILLRKAGLELPLMCTPLELAEYLLANSWTKIPVGEHEAGDIGSTCGSFLHRHDHVYLVVRVDGDDALTVADNEADAPHVRSVSGEPDKKPATRYFLRA